MIIVGPTAVGKTDLSIFLAEKYGGEIVSADSRQVYRFMDIGTAKPTSLQLAHVKHFFINIRFPNEYYSAGEFGREARECIYGLFKKNIKPIIVGGSGFYLRALIDGLYAPKVSNTAVKEKWRLVIQQKGNNFAYQHLKKNDPESAKRIHPNDSQRIIRAIEVQEITGRPLSLFKSGDEEPADFKPVFIGLTRPRKKLYERIERRVDLMLQEGLINEVETLISNGYNSELNALQTVGYKEVFNFFDQKLSREEMVNQIKTNSRRYAKRQMTWFGKDERINWIDVENIAECQRVVEIEKILEREGY